MTPSTPSTPSLLTRSALVALLGAVALAIAPARIAQAANDFSPAEQALFMDNHLRDLKPPQTLHFRYRKAGSLESAFDDSVDIQLSAKADGSCCAAKGRFFSGERQVREPELESAEGNPIILYFLERDIREMERLTKGKANYFRKRIRMAVYQGAQIRTASMPFGSGQVEVREISISPYADDPNRARFETLIGKRYTFLLSSAVPGGVYGIRTRIDGETADAPPLMTEEFLLDPATPAKR